VKTVFGTVLALLAVLQGCRQADSVVLVNVDAETGVPPVTALRVTMSTVKAHDAKTFPAQASAAPVHFPASLVLRIPRSRSGRLDLVLEGLDAAGQTVASGTAETVIVVGGQVTVYSVLTPGPMLCGNGVTDPGEECDDGNLVSFDGCDFRCRAEGVGPDAGVVDGATPDIEDVGGVADVPVDKPVTETARDAIVPRDLTVDAGLPDAPRVADAASDRMDTGTGGTADTGGSAGDTGCSGTAGPTMVRLPEGYCIDSTEVTRSQYQAWLATNPSTAGQISDCTSNTTFAPETSCLNEYPPVCATHCDNHPQVCVDWCDAYAYCTAAGKRLCGKIGGGRNELSDYKDPSLSQWYNACTSHDPANHRFPYGNAYQAKACNGPDYLTDETQPVGTLMGCQSSVLGYGGVYDLSGNVSEWEDSCDGTGTCRLRGGAVGNSAGMYLTCDVDSYVQRWRYGNLLGFRCCSSP
jgi:formylglycine-generating enzyme